MFDSEQTLGQEQTRVVVLRGTTTVSQFFSPNFFDVRGDIVSWLSSAGFSVNAVRMSPANWIGYSNNLEIELNVYLRHSAEEVRQRAIQVIESITRNFGTVKLFHNTTLSVASDNMPVVRSSPRPVPAQNPPSQYDQTNNLPVQDGSGNFLDNFALGLGVSTPVAVLGGGVLLLLLLKR